MFPSHGGRTEKKTTPHPIPHRTQIAPSPTNGRIGLTPSVTSPRDFIHKDKIISRLTPFFRTFFHFGLFFINFVRINFVGKILLANFE